MGTGARGNLSQMELEPEEVEPTGKLSQREVEPTGKLSQREVEPTGKLSQHDGKAMEIFFFQSAHNKYHKNNHPSTISTEQG